MINHNTKAVMAALAVAIEERAAEAEKFVRSVAIQALADAQRLSPVDTGLYRSAHQLTLRKPGGIAISADDYRRRTATRKARAAASAATLTSLASLPEDRLPGASVTVHLWNPLIYAYKLEDGHSLQAPTGIYSSVRALALQRLKRGPGVATELLGNSIGRKVT